MNPLDVQVYYLSERIKTLEKKVFKSNRQPITMGKKLLLLREMGLIEIIGKEFNTKENLYSFLSICLDEDSANIKKYLNNRKPLEIEDNFNFIIDTYTKLKLDRHLKSAKEKLRKIEKKE